MQLRRWLTSRATPPAPAGSVVGFDAVISVGPYNLPPGIAPGRAVAAIKQAVQAMPGACWIDVEHYAVGSGDGAVEVFPSGTSRPADEALRLQVEAVALAAVEALSSQPAAAMPRIESVARSVTGPGVSEGQQLRFVQTLQDFSSSVPEVAPLEVQPTAAGLRALGDADLLGHLLALVLPTGAPEAASHAVAQLGSFAAVLAAPELKLRKLPGLGTHSIAAIKLLHAVALRLSRAAIMDQPLLDGSAPLIDYLTAVLARESIEHFRILFLDAQNRLRADEAQARGTVDHAPVYPREVARRAMELQATSIILVHNHPGGDPSPSPADLAMTAMVAEAAGTLGITVRDHIIVGTGRWYSFRDEGMLDD